MTVRVDWSSVNYKDALATIPDGRVARMNPLVPGIDLAGEVIASDDPAIPVGSAVLAHGYDLGVAHQGGYAEYNRLPAGWIVPLPDGLSARDAMTIGTAGFTAALSVARLEARGLDPSDGPVLVTGAIGWRRPDGDRDPARAGLRDVGFHGQGGRPRGSQRPRRQRDPAVATRSTAESARPLESERWAAAVDCVGGATLPYLLRTLRYGGAVAASGNTGGAAFSTTVFPFILRGVALIGVDSAQVPIAERRVLWERLASDLRPRALGDRVTEVTLDTLPEALDGILAGRAHGRWLVRVAG